MSTARNYVAGMRTMQEILDEIDTEHLAALGRQITRTVHGHRTFEESLQCMATHSGEKICGLAILSFLAVIATELETRKGQAPNG